MKKKIRVPYKQQMADADCGPACLAMILGAYGHHMSVYSARLMCEQLGQPQSLRSLVMAARTRGMNAELMAADLETLPQIVMPCIIHWNFNHFVVLERIDGSQYVISDPAFGRRSVGKHEFSASFTGILAQMTPGSSFITRKKERNENFRSFTIVALKEARAIRLIAWTLLAAFFIQLMSLLAPALTVYIVDVVVAANARQIHFLLLPIILSASISIGLMNGLKSRAVVYLQSQVDEVLLSGFVKHILRLPAQFFLEKGVADIQSRMNSSTVIRDATSIYVVSASLDVIMSLGYLIVLAFISPIFSLLTAALISAQLAVYAAHMHFTKDKISAEIKTQATYQAYVYELLTGVLTVKAASAEEKAVEVWRRKLKNYLISSKERTMADGRLDAIISTMRIVSPALLLWYSILGYFNHTLTLGTILAINTIAATALIPVVSLVSTVRQFQFALMHAERLSDVWMHEPERRGGELSPSLEGTGEIRLRNVRFRYKGRDSFALNGVSIDIPLGKKVGIVGPSGSGKSTLISLLMGFQEPQEGHIEINGAELSSLDLGDYRKRIGYVSQDTFLFSSSVRSNVTLGASDTSLSCVEEVIALAGLSSMIEGLPMGVDSPIGNNGTTLSGGQRQRMAIARALLRKPELLILDEATSSLDSDTEIAVARAIAKQGGTQVIISHRLGTIKNCDLIYVIENGNITGRGTHCELLTESSFYRSCYAHQSTNDLNMSELVWQVN